MNGLALLALVVACLICSGLVGLAAAEYLARYVIRHRPDWTVSQARDFAVDRRAGGWRWRAAMLEPVRRGWLARWP